MTENRRARRCLTARYVRVVVVCARRQGACRFPEFDKCLVSAAAGSITHAPAIAKVLDFRTSRGNRIECRSGWRGVYMEWRIESLEADVRRLRKEFEALKTDIEKRRETWLNRALLAGYLITTAVLFGAMWHGLGWI